MDLWQVAFSILSILRNRGVQVQLWENGRPLVMGKFSAHYLARHKFEEPNPLDYQGRNEAWLISQSTEVATGTGGNGAVSESSA